MRYSWIGAIPCLLLAIAGALVCYFVHSWFAWEEQPLDADWGYRCRCGRLWHDRTPCGWGPI